MENNFEKQIGNREALIEIKKDKTWIENKNIYITFIISALFTYMALNKPDGIIGMNVDNWWFQSVFILLIITLVFNIYSLVPLFNKKVRTYGNYRAIVKNNGINLNSENAIITDDQILRFAKITIVKERLFRIQLFLVATSIYLLVFFGMPWEIGLFMEILITILILPLIILILTGKGIFSHFDDLKNKIKLKRKYK